MITAFTCDTQRLHPVAAGADEAALRDAVWIDLVNPTPDEAARVCAATGFTVPSEAGVSEIETSSRLAMRDGVLYLSMPLINRSEDGARGVPAGFVLSPKRLLTVRFAPSSIFDNFVVHMPRGDDPNLGSAHILMGLLEAIVDRQADALEQVGHELDAVSHRIFAMGVRRAGGRKREDATLRVTLGKIGRIGDLISHIRDTLVGAGRIGPFLESAAAEWLPHDLPTRLKTLQSDIVSISDFDTHLNDKLQFLLDATLGFISIAQNNVMKVLTIASVVGIPPVLVAGIYGMNFKTVPEYDWSFGYAYGLGLIAVTAIIPLLIFRWRNWI